MAVKKEVRDLYRREWNSRLEKRRRMIKAPASRDEVMKKEKTAHWIQRTHLFRADAYVCSFCTASFPEPYEICPACGAVIKKIKYDPSWVNEAEMLDNYFGNE